MKFKLYYALLVKIVDAMTLRRCHFRFFLLYKLPFFSGLKNQ